MLQRRALHPSDRNSPVSVMSFDQPPALTRLALDERLTGLALGVQGIKVLLQSLLGRLAGINGAASERRLSVFHVRSVLPLLSARRTAAPTSGSRRSSAPPPRVGGGAGHTTST